MNKKIIIEVKPSKPIFPKEIAQGHKNAISKSENKTEKVLTN